MAHLTIGPLHRCTNDEPAWGIRREGNHYSYIMCAEKILKHSDDIDEHSTLYLHISTEALDQYEHRYCFLDNIYPHLGNTLANLFGYDNADDLPSDTPIWWTLSKLV